MSIKEDQSTNATNKSIKNIIIDIQSWYNLLNTVNSNMTNILAIKADIEIIDKRLNFYKKIIDDLKEKIKKGE
ncbi:MAG: hypothetical protein ACTSQJ_00270 [Promethearchaeota archaeon]